MHVRQAESTTFPSPRDPRRVWARFTRDLRERPFRNPHARFLAGWAAAIATAETFAAWQAEHPGDAGPFDREAGR